MNSGPFLWTSISWHCHNNPALLHQPVLLTIWYLSGLLRPARICEWACVLVKIEIYIKESWYNSGWCSILIKNDIIIHILAILWHGTSGNIADAREVLNIPNKDMFTMSCHYVLVGHCSRKVTDENFKITLQILQVQTPKSHIKSVSSLCKGWLHCHSSALASLMRGLLTLQNHIYKDGPLHLPESNF